MRGDDPYQIAVGPIHAGVIESGHFRFHVVGDRILHLDARLFYKHRGLERAAEGKTLDDGLAFAARACAACAVTNGVAYAHACEEALGLAPTAELARARTILLELERMWSHFNDIAAVCAGVGMAAGNNQFAALTERARRLNATLTGHRFLFGSVRVGGSDLALDGDAVRAAREEVAALRTESARSWRELLFNASFQDRLPDIGVVAAEEAARLGALGPAARAAGLAEDARAESRAALLRRPRAHRPEAGRRRRARPVRAAGARAPADLRPARTAARPPRQLGRRRGRHGGAARSASAASRARAARRAASSSEAANRIERLRLRTGSYANWPAVAHAAVDNLLPDFPLINKSFELCYACADR